MIIPCSNFLTKPKGEKTFYKSHVRMRRYEQLMRSICELSKISSFFMAFVIRLSKKQLKHKSQYRGSDPVFY